MQQATMKQYADPMEGLNAMQPATPAQATPVQASLPVGPEIKHVQIREASGAVRWQPVEARTADMARVIVGQYLDHAEILQVVDSMLRAAQLSPALPMPGEPEMGGPEDALAEEMGMPAPGGGENIETASLDAQTEETIKAALLHYRNTGVGIAEATDNFVNSYGKFLDRYGDKTSPARHLIEATVIRIAKETYEKPALTQQQPPQMMMAQRRRADEAKGPSPKKINEQQDDWVSLGDGGEVLGPDSTTQDGYPTPRSKIKPQQDTIALQPGSDGADTSTEPGTDSRDPGDFGAGKGYDSDGHVTFDGPGWGQSWSDTDLGDDSQTGDNDTTSDMDSVSSGAYQNVRSK